MTKKEKKYSRTVSSPRQGGRMVEESRKGPPFQNFTQQKTGTMNNYGITFEGRVYNQKKRTGG